MKKYVCLHGHFYQPPRENPWTETIERQDSAYPFHDWNERIAAECYDPNANARIPYPNSEIENCVKNSINNYQYMSFNFGPTLLSWIKNHDRPLLAKLIETDVNSQTLFNGHGAAIAQGYHHIILPLANSRDKYTQIAWGIHDFKHIFNRDPEGFWLPETAVDLESLEILADFNIKFVILAPKQANKIRKINDNDHDWQDVSQGNIDTTCAYLQKLPSGKEMAIFFYHDEIAKKLAFGDLLTHGENFLNEIMSQFKAENNQPQLVNLAVDGETYGHHHQNGERALAYAIHAINKRDDAEIILYADFLERFPPQYEVQIFENSSWSCAHGIERWKNNCGCNSGKQPEWQQHWRAPLRHSLDFLRDQLNTEYEQQLALLVKDPWQTRNDYIHVIHHRDLAAIQRFENSNCKSIFSLHNRITLLKWMELQRHLLLMYTSCGWFFDEVSGLETIQVMQYAARAMQLANELLHINYEPKFLELLAQAPSNLPQYEHGKHIYESRAKSAMLDVDKIVAEHTLSPMLKKFEQQLSQATNKPLITAKIPIATYRLQLSKNFTIKQTTAILDYLKNLGISDLYLSPITQAQAGSEHGYDVIDPLNFNYELGDQHNFSALSAHLKNLNMGLIIDIVPNHMAAVKDNIWFADVLQKFDQSPYYNFFDIDRKQSTSNQLVYRRFFDINQLICLRVEDPNVFAHTHQLIFKLITQNLITGLRIDHIDGLINPGEYLQKLSEFSQHSIYIILEKILARDELINPAWHAQGTTGYDFMNELNQIYIHATGFKQLKNFYQQHSQQPHEISTLRYCNCKRAIQALFNTEFEALKAELMAIKDQLKTSIANDELATCLLEFSANLPVYRTYITDKIISPQDQIILQKTKIATKANAPQLAEDSLEFLYQILTLSLRPRDEIIHDLSLSFIKRWQVFTGPVVAKAYEDTTCYQFYPLLSLNEVGSDPDFFKLNDHPLNLFHQYQRNRFSAFPYSLNATSTHDTKRSEDVRARLNVLAELADETLIFFENSIRCNHAKKTVLDQELIPDVNDELMIYQLLLAAWPLASNEMNNFKQRFAAYLVKSLREAKIHSNWQQPQTAYEQAAVQFCETILTETQDNTFLNEFFIFQRKIAFFGMLNSLSQLVLKITCPGVPDFYQGNEVWRFDLVDPDNRRAINFAELKKVSTVVKQIENKYGDDAIFTFLENWQNGYIKFFLTQKLLHIRQQHYMLFNDGNYVPLQVDGPHRESIIAFMRCHSEKKLLVMIPRWFSKFVAVDQFHSDPYFWQDTVIRLPIDAPTEWQSVLENKQFCTQINGDHAVLHARDVFAELFFGVLMGL